MKIVLASDEYYPVHQDIIIQILHTLGHQVDLFGACASHREEPWVEVADKAAQSIINGSCDEGIFLCWTGTGISIAANKIPGIRAALCTTSETARGARLWNHANVLALSNQLMTRKLAEEILHAWFEPYNHEKGLKGVQSLIELDNRFRKIPAQTFS
ncbi:ribose-5-phosphate isomerase B [Caedimonas varicaedens]|uniref:Ribose-5-phosphate isomerase B n=1 Tax=Caedimonas varicaedens TaxID=1629334 RepID=A0A0K8MEQ8_9PROT|nr:ribose-5-phosphate isomerase B [Caedimonas varicaedens]